MEISNWEAMADALDRAGTERSILYLSTKSEVVGYFQQEHGAHWSRELAKALQPFTRAKNGEPQKITNIQRRFQPSRLEKAASKANVEQYRALGKKLPGTIVEKPRKVAGKRARVETKVSMTISKEKKPRQRTIKEVLTSSQMSQLRHADLTGLIDAYGGINPEEIMFLEFHAPVRVEYL